MFDSPAGGSTRNIFMDDTSSLGLGGGAGNVKRGKNLFSSELDKNKRALADVGGFSGKVSREGSGSGSGFRDELPGQGPVGGERFSKDWSGGQRSRGTESVLSDRFVAQRSANGALSAPPTWGGAGESLSSLSQLSCASGDDRSGSFRGIGNSTSLSIDAHASHPSDESATQNQIHNQAEAIKDSALLNGRGTNMTADEERQALAAAARNAAALGLDFSQQILTFAPKAPGAGGASMRGRKPVHPVSNNNSSSLAGRRKISSRPDKVLDAADICDDFYYNLIDWSVRNQVAIALRGAVYVWDCESAEVFALVDLAEESERVGGGEAALITSLRWHLDGGYIIIGTEEGYAQLWDTEQRRRLRTFKPNAERDAMCSAICAMDWADNVTVTLGYVSGLVVDHDIREANSVIRKLQAHSGSACGIKWRDDGKLLATGGNDNTVKVWSRESDEPIMTRSEHKAAVKAISWSPFNANIFATGGGSACRTINIWNCETNARLISWQTESQISSIHWSWYHRELLTTHGSADGTPSGSINIWSYPSGKNLHRIDKAHEGRILGSVLSPDGQKLASVDTGANELRFWTVFEATDEQQKRHRQQKGAELYNPLARDEANGRSHGLLR